MKDRTKHANDRKVQAQVNMCILWQSRGFRGCTRSGLFRLGANLEN